MRATLLVICICVALVTRGESLSAYPAGPAAPSGPANAGPAAAASVTAGQPV